MKKLVLFDGMAMVYRAYYALSGSNRTNSKGVNTSAVLGFTTTLYDLVKKLQPTHMAVAFDLQKPTFRHKMYEEYKANREAMPEAIQVGLPYIRSIISAFNIPIITCEGYEADDVIGTASHWAETQGFDQVIMVTPDKDFGQLVTPHVYIYRFGRIGKPDQLMGVEEVKEKFNVDCCQQVIDLLGLWGDASDNIPGIPGVGEKTAKKLIAQFGSIENMVTHAEEIKNDKIRGLVQQYSEQALFSKQLATIVLDAPLTLSEEMFRVQKPDYAALQELFTELEFRNLSKRIYTDLSVSDPSEAQRFAKAAQAPRISKPAASAAKTVTDSQPTLFEQPTLFDTPAVDPSRPLDIRTLDHLPDNGDVAVFVSGATIVVAFNADTVYTALVGDIDIAALRTLLQRPGTGTLNLVEQSRQHLTLSGRTVVVIVKTADAAVRKRGIAVKMAAAGMERGGLTITGNINIVVFHHLDFILCQRDINTAEDVHRFDKPPEINFNNTINMKSEVHVQAFREKPDSAGFISVIDPAGTVSVVDGYIHIAHESDQ